MRVRFNHRAILLEATSYIYVIRKLWESWPTRVGSNSVTSVNTHKYILLMYQKNVCLKTKKKVLYFIKCTSFNDVLRSAFIYFLPLQYKSTFLFAFLCIRVTGNFLSKFFKYVFLLKIYKKYANLFSFALFL